MRNIILAVFVAMLAFPALTQAQESSSSSVSVGVGDASDVTLTAPLYENLSLLLTSTRHTLSDDMDMGMTSIVSRVSGGVRYSVPVHQRVTLYSDVGFGGWFGDGVVNPRETWRNVDFRLGGKLYVKDSWGVGLSGGYRQVGDNLEIQNIIKRPSETPWAVSLFGEF